jgi:hypothetical protein
MRKIRIYRMTIASAWYDNRAEVQREFEMHFKVARRGQIRTVRRTLARRGIPYFQQSIYRKFGRWIPRRRIRGRNEGEEPGLLVERDIFITGRSMTYRGRDRRATRLPVRVLSYAKRKQKRRSPQRKRA